MGTCRHAGNEKKTGGGLFGCGSTVLMWLVLSNVPGCAKTSNYSCKIIFNRII